MALYSSHTYIGDLKNKKTNDTFVICAKWGGKQMKIKNEIINNEENPLYHDTWQLLKKYRDVVWSLET
jgi:hypothetical protein